MHKTLRSDKGNTHLLAGSRISRQALFMLGKSFIQDIEHNCLSQPETSSRRVRTLQACGAFNYLQKKTSLG